MVLVQKWPFFKLLFWENIDQENIFYHILERKNAFLSYKKKKFKNSNNWPSPKGVYSMFFLQKGPFFQIFFLGNIGQKNVFYDILERKNAFLGYKKKKFKKSKNWHFSNFRFSGNIGQENVFNDILERKNAFLGYKNKKFKKSKNWHFSKGVNPWF